MVAKAFQVLSDGNKRAIYDQTGGDPDSRGGGGGGGGMASAFNRGGGAQFHGGGMGGAEELSPEDLFRFFFGQGGGAQFGGGGFGGNSGFRTQFYGPGGIRMQTNARQPQAGAGQPAREGSVWLQIAPLLALLAFSALTQIPSLFMATPTPAPDFAFRTSPQFTIFRSTAPSPSGNSNGGGGVGYWVNAQQFSRHPLYEEELLQNGGMGFAPKAEIGTSAYRQELFSHIVSAGASPTALPTNVVPEAGGAAPAAPPTPPAKQRKVVTTAMRKFERIVENSWIEHLRNACQQALQSRQQRLEQARGFLGFGADYAKVR